MAEAFTPGLKVKESVILLTLEDAILERVCLKHAAHRRAILELQLS